MQHLTKLFKLMEITRTQPQYGYNIAGVSKDHMSDLAQHHYLVTFMGWQIARALRAADYEVNLERVMEICLIHDIGELFGGDISFFYSRANLPARKAAKEFEAINMQFLAQFFGNDEQYVMDLYQEMIDEKTTESIIAKIADYLECMNYKFHFKYLDHYDTDTAIKIADKAVDKFADAAIQAVMREFLHAWVSDLQTETALDIIWNTKKD